MFYSQKIYLILPMLFSLSSQAYVTKTNMVKAPQDSIRNASFQFINPGSAQRKIEFHGTARATYHGSNMNYSYQAGPATYYTYEIVPQLKVGSLVFSAPLRFNTQQRALSYNLNSVSISFDREAFRKEILEKARERANLQSKFRDSLQHELEKQIASITDLGFLKDTLQKQLNSLKPDTAALRDSLLPDSLNSYTDTARLQQLRVQIDSLENLYQKALEARERFQQLKDVGFFGRPDDFLTPDPLSRRYKGSRYYALSRGERFFSRLQTLQLGNFNPQYSSLYIQGINLSGLNTEIQAGAFYMAFSGGLINQHLNFNTLNPTLEKRWLWGGRFGIGQKEGTHLYFSAFSSELKSRTRGDSSSRFDLPSPDNNRVVSAEFRINSSRFSYISGEYAVSSTSSSLSLRDSVSGEEISQQTIPSRLFSADLSRHAWKLGYFLELPKYGSRFSAEASRTGTFYHTVGNPYLRKDLFRQQLKLSQPLYKKLLRLNSTVTLDRDNLSGIKLYTAKYQTYSNSVDIRIKRLPMLKLMHTYRSQFTQAKNDGLRNRVQQLTLLSTYQRVFKVDHRFSWMLAASLMDFRQSGMFSQKTFFTTVSQIYTWKEKLSISYSGNILFTGPGDTSVVNSHLLSAAYKYRKMSSGLSGRINHDWRNGRMAGIMITHEMALWKNASFKMEAGINRFEKLNEFVSQHRQYLIQLQVTQIW